MLPKYMYPKSVWFEHDSSDEDEDEDEDEVAP
jgi:hypothetical protein